MTDKEGIDELIARSRETAWVAHADMVTRNANEVVSALARQSAYPQSREDTITVLKQIAYLQLGIENMKCLIGSDNDLPTCIRNFLFRIDMDGEGG